MLLQIKSHLRVHTNETRENEGKPNVQDYFVIVTLKLWWIYIFCYAIFFFPIWFGGKRNIAKL